MVIANWSQMPPDLLPALLIPTLNSAPSHSAITRKGPPAIPPTSIQTYNSNYFKWSHDVCSNIISSALNPPPSFCCISVKKVTLLTVYLTNKPLGLGHTSNVSAFLCNARFLPGTIGTLRLLVHSHSCDIILTTGTWLMKHASISKSIRLVNLLIQWAELTGVKAVACLALFVNYPLQSSATNRQIFFRYSEEK